MTTTATNTDKVNFESLVNATVKATNNSDPARIYDIEADVTMRDSQLESVNSGQVYTKGTKEQVASFSKYMGGGLNLNFMNETSESDQCSILTAINSFINDTRLKIAAKPLSSNNL